MQFGTMAVVLVFLSQHFIAFPAPFPKLLLYNSFSKATKGYKSWYY